MDRVLLIGGFAETIELCELCGLEIVGIIDNELEGHLSGYPVIGNDSDAAQLYLEYYKYPVIISPDKPSVREKLYELYTTIGFKIYTLISPKAFISPSAQIAEGSIIQSFCNISTRVKLGKCVKINTYANIMHDVKADDFVTIAPNAVILGYVHIERKSYIGANSTIIQTNRIGESAVVGAGAVVTKDVEKRQTVIGVPAKVMK